MELFDTVTKEMFSICFQFEQLILAPIMEGFSKKAYEDNLFQLQQRVLSLKKNETLVLKQLDSTFIEDEKKFDRLVSQWENKIQDAKAKIFYNFSDESLPLELQAREQLFWTKYMAVKAKIYPPGDNVISLPDLAVYFAYTLHELLSAIQKKKNDIGSSLIPPHMEVDLTKFNLQGFGTHPYFKAIHQNKKYFIYEGAIGANRYQYFEIPEKAKAGLLCKKFNEKYIERNEPRFNFYDDVEEIILQVQNEKKIIKLNGLEAYYKYWASHSDEEKARTHFNVIPHFEALKEWFSLRLPEFIEINQIHYIDDEIREIEIKKVKRELLTTIEGYLKPPVPPIKFSILSSAHVRELNRFYKYLKIEDPNKQNEIEMGEKESEKLKAGGEKIDPIEIRLKEMLVCNDFNELIQKFGDLQVLLAQYEKGLDFAPDTKTYIETKISNLEGALANYSCTCHVWDTKQEKELTFQCAEYKRIGFAWVNIGYNGTKDDYEIFLYKNINLQRLDTTEKGRNQIRLHILCNLAEGGALAFYIAFLRKELTGKLPLPKRKTPQRQSGTIRSLKDLFIKTSDFSKAVNALQKIKVVDRQNVNLIGSKLKGVMQVWVNILKTDRSQLKSLDDKQLTLLLNQFFQNLNLSEKTDGKHFRNSINKTASNKYRAKLLALM